MREENEEKNQYNANKNQQHEETKKEFLKGFGAWGVKKVIAEHTVKGGETLSHIALEYYGSATKPYWMVIYEENKQIIGEDPNRVPRGIVLKIPELPIELRKD